MDQDSISPQDNHSDPDQESAACKGTVPLKTLCDDVFDAN